MTYPEALSAREIELRKADDLRANGFSLEVPTSWFRCGNCNRPQRAGTVMVYVPDGTMEGDPWWCVKEELKQAQDTTGWCTPCARKLMNNR